MGTELAPLEDASPSFDTRSVDAETRNHFSPSLSTNATQGTSSESYSPEETSTQLRTVGPPAVDNTPIYQFLEQAAETGSLPRFPPAAQSTKLIETSTTTNAYFVAGQLPNASPMQPKVDENWLKSLYNVMVMSMQLTGSEKAIASRLPKAIQTDDLEPFFETTEQRYQVRTLIALADCLADVGS